MADQRTLEITLRLNEIDDLFYIPKTSPLSEEYGVHSSQPALEFIADEVYANSSNRRVVATFELPAVALDSNRVENVRTSIRRWAGAKLRRVDHDVAAMRWRGVRSLGFGLIAFFAFIYLSQVIGTEGDNLSATLGKGLEIAAWVVLWFPLDMLFFSVWQYRLDRRAYRLVRDMELNLIAVVG